MSTTELGYDGEGALTRVDRNGAEKWEIKRSDGRAELVRNGVSLATYRFDELGRKVKISH